MNDSGAFKEVELKTPFAWHVTISDRVLQQTSTEAFPTSTKVQINFHSETELLTLPRINEDKKPVTIK